MKASSYIPPESLSFQVDSASDSGSESSSGPGMTSETDSESVGGLAGHSSDADLFAEDPEVQDRIFGQRAGAECVWSRVGSHEQQCIWSVAPDFMLFREHA